jgi:hypothetical protein
MGKQLIFIFIVLQITGSSFAEEPSEIHSATVEQALQSAELYGLNFTESDQSCTLTRSR